MASTIGRNAKNLFSNTPLSPAAPTVSFLSGTYNRVNEIGRKDFIKTDSLDDHDNDDLKRKTDNLKSIADTSQFNSISFRKLNNGKDDEFSKSRNSSGKEEKNSNYITDESAHYIHINTPGASSGSNPMTINQASPATIVYKPQRNPIIQSNKFFNEESESFIEENNQKNSIEDKKRIADEEKAELLKALEALKQQNQLLTNQMNHVQLTSQNQLEQERKQRQLAISELENEKIKLHSELMETKIQTEKRLKEEREEFFQLLRKLEEEKELLNNKMLEIEMKSNEEAGFLKLQQIKLKDQVNQLEEEKIKLDQQLKNNELNRITSNENISNQFNIQQNELKKSIELLENEKLKIFHNLQITENLAKTNEENLMQQFQSEKNNLLQNVKNLEIEKDLLYKKILQSEESNKIQDDTLNIQKEIENEGKEYVQKSINKKEEESLVIQNELNKLNKEDDELNHNKLLKEKEQLEILLKDMSNEKKLLNEKLQLIQQTTEQREKILLEQMVHEKEDLMRYVLKMKKDLKNNRNKINYHNSSHDNSFHSIASSSVDSHQSGGSGFSLKALNPYFSSNRSLFEALGDSNVNSSGVGMYDIISTGSLEEQQPTHRTIQKSLSPSLDSNPSSKGLPLSTSSHHNSSYHQIHFHKRSMNNFLFTKHNRQVSKILENPTQSDSFMDDDDDWDELEEQDKKNKGDNSKDATSPMMMHGEEKHMDVSNNNESQDDEILNDLPAPHAAAALGELKRLRSIEKLDKSLLISLDSIGRKPLFYAAAYGRDDVIDYLCKLFQSHIMDGDHFGDTPLHAACSAGNHLGAELLILSSHGVVEPRNQMSMTPAHLASTAECLEILYKHNAELASLDINKRSPLFIACAMNREACAEFLIGCLDQIEVSLIIQDHRGDTPLHAAACNGAEECVILLLQHGIDPRLENHQNLKAIDLAIRNEHRKCRDMLAEYYLHFCTSSEFDSVLFLATLEGYKTVSLLSSELPSDPLNLHQVHANGSPGLKKAPSMFSLKGNQSLRLHRYGAWLLYQDQQSNKEFWYNHETNVGQWEMPEQVIQLQKKTQRGVIKDNFDKVLNSNMSMRLKKVGDWIQYVSEHGKTFYYNSTNGNFQWENPHEPFMNHHDGSDKTMVTTTTAATTSSVVTPSNETTLPPEGEPEWKPYVDPESGCIFWYNSITFVSQWDCPFGLEDDTNAIHQTVEMTNTNQNLKNDQQKDKKSRNRVVVHHSQTTSNPDKANKDLRNEHTASKKESNPKRRLHKGVNQSNLQRRESLDDEQLDAVQIRNENELGI